jgi:epoxyqueuosine reductase
MLTERIKQRAVELGFDLVGIAPAAQAINAESYYRWLKEGYNGTMNWLARDPSRRCDPTQVLEGAKSLVVVGKSYYIEDPDPAIWNDPMRGRIARYAWGRDYHKVIAPLLKQLGQFIYEEAPGTTGRSYVDYGPILEHDFAASAGLGFIGKHSFLINPQMGSYVFLGEVLVDIELEYDQPADERGSSMLLEVDGKQKQGACGSCVRCMHACPTFAFPAPFVLDSRKCISYLTIELREAIPEALRSKMGHWVFGCDDCQSVCPWVQQYSTPSRAPWLQCDADRIAPRLDELMALDDEGFLKRFAGTPVMRPKRRGLLRNAAVALGNSGMDEAVPVLKQAANDPDPLVREHVAWALSQLES